VISSPITILNIYRDAKEAVSLPGLDPADRKAIVSEFISLLPNERHTSAPTTLRAVRASLLKEANADDRVPRTTQNTTGEAKKAPQRRKARNTGPKA